MPILSNDRSIVKFARLDGPNAPLAVAVCLAVVMSLCGRCASAVETHAMIRLEMDGRKIIGRPLAFDNQRVIILRRDGRIATISIHEVDGYSKVADRFTPYSRETILRRLQNEFSHSFQVSRTAHFVVVHPEGQRKQWAEPFDRLYDQFTHYFEVRGIHRSHAEFPLIAVVLPGRNLYYEYAAKDGIPNPQGIAGYYSLLNNRIITYDQGASRSVTGDWEGNHITLVHEALHQFAFNTGIHSRWAPPPKWATEGLAGMFEARGVYDGNRHTNPEDRNHELYLPYLRRQISRGRVRGQIASLVTSDRLFSTDPDLAYALSWGMAFYFSETQPRNFHGYLKITGQREAFTAYEASMRARDFAQFFGNDFPMLESRLAQFLGTR